MAPFNQLSVLAFASAALAVPHAQWQPFKRHAHPAVAPAYGDGSSSAGAVPGGYGSSSAAPVSSSGAPYSYSSSSGYPHPTGSYRYGASYGTGYSAKPTGYYPSSSYSGSVSVCTETSTLIYRSTTEYSTYEITHTLGAPASSGAATSPAPDGYGTIAASAAPASESAPAYGGGHGGVGGEDGGSCVPDVTVTKTEKSTIYVTASDGATSSGPAASAPASYPAAGSSGAPAASSYSHDGSSGAPAASSWTAAPSSVTEVSTSASAVLSSYPSSSPATSSSSAAPSSSAPASSSAGKRGLAYNDASLIDMFTSSSSIGWAYNWESDPKGSTSGLPYLPMLHDMTDMFTSIWAADAKTGIDGGAQYLFSFNEPDLSNGANLTPEAAAAGWMQYMEPFAGQAKLVAPSVSNGQGDDIGFGWLQQFLTACSDCTIDAVNVHWYWGTNDVSEFKTQVGQMIGTGKEVFVSEFAAIGTDEEKSDFLDEVMPWMDGQSSIVGYAYFMVADGLLCSGGAPSAYGDTYMA